MRLRKIGTFEYKGSHSLYVEAVDLSTDTPRYAAIEYGFLDERESRALNLGQIVDTHVLDSDPHWWLHHRLDDCFR